ncbi:hypothetical protein HAX54_003235, partial [Datura stramonium]|nr:hypothetical protein [Datura stramonium]
MTTSPSTKPPSTAPPTPMTTSPDIPQSPPNIPDVPPLASLPPPIEEEVGSLMASSTGGSSDSSREISPSSLSPKDESATGPSSPYVEVDLPSLIADIQARYVLQDLALVSPTPNRASRSLNSSNLENVTVLAGSSSEFDSADELVPSKDLKK